MQSEKRKVKGQGLRERLHGDRVLRCTHEARIKAEAESGGGLFTCNVERAESNQTDELPSPSGLGTSYQDYM